MANHSIAAGLLMCRKSGGQLEFFLVHPGGPFFKNKNEGVWTIPKGLPEPNEDLLTTAQREFTEETGIKCEPPFHSLGSIKQKGGKTVHAWCFLGEWDPADGVVANTFRMEWPPKSGRFAEFPEQDRAEWMTYERAKTHVVSAQVELLQRAQALYQSLK